MPYFESANNILGSLSLLYVEDDSFVQEQLAQFLRRRVGCLLTANNGAEGLELYCKHHPDIVITDILMPVMDGLIMAQEIKNLDRDVPIIMTTAFEQSHYLMRSIEVGVDKYILKPIDTSLLIDALNACALRLKEREDIRLASKVFENSLEAILITDAKNRICSVNPAFVQMTGYLPHEVLGQNPRLLSSGRQDQDFYQAMWRKIKDQGSWKGEIWNRRKNGEIYPEWLSINVLKDKFGAITHYVGMFSDISERKAAEESIKFLAHHDPLTGLPNRNLLVDRVNIALANANRKQENLALLLFDLDHFKQVNDCFGHQMGDELLIKIGEIIKSLFRANDTVCRLGGDEFVVVLTNNSGKEIAQRAAEYLLKNITPDLTINDQEMGVSPSIGIAIYPEDGTDLEMLLKHADSAMYASKRKGGNCFNFFNPE